jgi:NAD(P)-dependent dehydrogenase (short-subunit alcohol dehydrogenase family)
MTATNLFDIADRVIIITGGTGALGGSMAQHLLQAGARIVLLGLHPEKVTKSMAALKKISPQILGFSANVTDKERLLEVRDAILQKWGKIDVLINAAGGNMPGATIGPNQNIFDLQMADFSSVVALNLDGSVLPSLVFGETMAAQGKGSIINISSMTATRAITRVVGYSASKAAIESYPRKCHCAGVLYRKPKQDTPNQRRWQLYPKGRDHYCPYPHETLWGSRRITRCRALVN